MITPRFKPGDFAYHKAEGKLFNAHVFLVYASGIITDLNGNKEEILYLSNPLFFPEKSDSAEKYYTEIEFKEKNK